LGNYTIASVFWVALLLGLLIALRVAYPLIGQKMTGDTAHHNLLHGPRHVPVRTSCGGIALFFYALLTVSGSNVNVSHLFDISLNVMTCVGRIGLIVLHRIAYYVARRFCVGLQRRDRDILEHGIETGTIRQLPSGEFIEVHQPLGGVDEHGHAIPLEYQGA